MNSASNSFSSWGEVISTSFHNLWIKIINFLPELLAAIVVLIIGLIIASLLSKLVKKLISYTKVDVLLEKMDVDKALKKAGIKLSLSGLIGWLVKWFIIIATLLAVVDILHITQLTTFLTDIVLYIPNVIIAVVILVIGLLVGKFIYDIVEKAVLASRIPSESAVVLAAISKWAIIIFSLLAALIQLKIADELIQILFTGIIAMLALAGGLALGLGAKDRVIKWIEDLDKKITRR